MGGVTNKTLILVVLIGVVFDLFVSAGVVLIATQANRAAMQAKSAASDARIAKVATYEACLSGNESRAESRALWLSITALLPNDPRSVVFKENILKVTGQAFQPRNCTQ